MSKLPDCDQKVEILVDGNWVPATFVCADYFTCDDGDEVWWLHYYRLEDGCTTVPEDIQSNARLPEWRAKVKFEQSHLRNL